MIDPITSDGALPVVKLAQQNKVPVIAYEGLIANAPLAGYITFNNEKVGELQAQYLARPRRDEAPPIAIMNGDARRAAGSPSRPGATRCSTRHLQAAGGLTTATSRTPPSWSTRQGPARPWSRR